MLSVCPLSHWSHDLIKRQKQPWFYCPFQVWYCPWPDILLISELQQYLREENTDTRQATLHHCRVPTVVDFLGTKSTPLYTAGLSSGQWTSRASWALWRGCRIHTHTDSPWRGTCLKVPRRGMRPLLPHRPWNIRRKPKLTASTQFCTLPLSSPHVF
jgi:hypothetical protein